MYTLFPAQLTLAWERAAYLFLLLMFYSFAGWCGEMVYCSIGQRKLCEKRGFLNGPICPIYGHGALVVLIVLRGGCESPVATFFLGALLTSAVEYITSYAMEKLFHMRWWDYSRYRFQLNGRICLLNSSLFGLASVVLCHGIGPAVSEGVLRLFAAGAALPLAAVLAVLLLRSLGVFGTPSAAETTPTPAPTAPVETVVPTETPTPTPTPKPEPTYEVVKADVSWADAEAAAEAKGGHLVVIDSAEKWTRVAQLADESGLTYVWIGLYRADSGELAWVKDNIDPVYNWAAGEPSVRDTNGAAENYVLIARRSDGWYYNDCIGDPAAKYPQFYGGKTGYIIEIDP